jgi:hypothetical protein
MEAAASAYCERRGVSFDQLLAQPLTRFAQDAAYQRRMAEWACAEVGWPEDLAGCLAVAARYQAEAEAALLELKPGGAGRLGAGGDPPRAGLRRAGGWKPSSSGCAGCTGKRAPKALQG